MTPQELTQLLGSIPKDLQLQAVLVGHASGERYELREVFDAYLRFGGMPGIADVGLDQERALTLLDGIYSTVVVRDILEREKRRGQRQITDPVLLRKIILFLADNIGSTVSANSIGNTLVNEGLLEEGARKTAPSAHTVQAYVGALLESYIFYEVKRFDIKGKEYLRTLGKYYIADIGLRNYLLGFRDRDTGHVLENIVYFELLRRGYDVAIGKIDNAEIDFIASNAEEKLYDLAELFKVFGDSTRIRILFVLSMTEMCVCDLAEALNMTASAISHQLRILKQSKLVKNRREGKTVFYSLDDDHVKAIIDQGMEHVEE